MNGYVDVHNHGLPNLDDGAHDMEEALAMMECCYKEGIRKIIFTPHVMAGKQQYEKEEVEKRYQELLQEMNRSEKLREIECFLGNEIFYNYYCIEMLNENRVFTMADSPYILVEFNYFIDFKHMKNALSQLLYNGYEPILAHAERYICLVKTISNVEDLVEMGILIQINTGTFLGKSGLSQKRFAKKILKKRWVSFIGTDAHNTKKRAPRMKKCARYIRKKVNKDYALQLLYENPNKLLNCNSRKEL